MRRTPIRRPVVQVSDSRRSGYTLVEMLIASILVATLMATVWNLTSLYSGFLTAGRAQAEEQQLARSLIDIISADLHALIPDRAGDTSISTAAPLPTREPTDFPGLDDRLRSEDELSDGSMSSPGFRNLFGLDAGEQLLPTFDVRGRAHTLTLTIADAEPQIELFPVDEETGEPLMEDSLPLDTTSMSAGADALPGPPRAPEYRRIVYHFVPPRIVETVSEDSPLPGLYRYEVPIEHLGLLTLNDEVPGANSLTGETKFGDLIEMLTEQGLTSLKEEHVPEVVGCEFEYLTDFGWESSWSPHEDGRPLKAIRIRLRLLSPEEHQELMTSLGFTEEPEDTDQSVSEVPLELAGGFDTDEDPFVEFEARTFERTILMSAPQPLTLGKDEGTSFRQGTATSSAPIFGGQP